MQGQRDAGIADFGLRIADFQSGNGRIEMASTIRVVPEEKMEAALDAEIRRCLCICFPPDVDVFSQTRKWHGCGPAWSVVLEEGPNVIAHLGAVERTVDADGELLRVAGLQNVFVLPEYRGKGYADKILEASMVEAARQGYDCGLLFCIPRIVDVYARCGWKTMPEVDVVRLDDDGQEKPLPGVNVGMYYPLKRQHLAPRRIHLRGNDW
jgi:GNAT superfamily N-acetyltransferase